ncbi:MAG: hypothetical protein JXA21_02280 [Anaerolineae bacterium]|nr:hypothetical protein [Anaerolineae bacterium]
MRRFWRVLLTLLLAAGGGWLLLANIPPVSLSWDTASEVGTAGFNVYRSPIAPTDFVQANPTLIPAQGDEVTGAAYSFEDDEVTAGRRYVYRIEEVEWDGTRTLYPETVTVRAGLPRFWTKVEGGVMVLLSIVLIWRGLKS